MRLKTDTKRVPHVRRFWIEYEDGSRSPSPLPRGGGMLTLLRPLLQDEKLRRPFVHSHSIGRPRSERIDSAIAKPVLSW